MAITIAFDLPAAQDISALEFVRGEPRPEGRGSGATAPRGPRLSQVASVGSSSSSNCETR